MTTSDLTPTLTRRTFLAAGGATVIYLAGCGAVQGSSDGVSRTADVVDTSPWIGFTKDGHVRVLVDKCEMGQGVRHMFASIVAEALGLTPDAVQVEDAPVEPKRYGNSNILPTVHGFDLGVIRPFQMTGRSSSTADMWGKLRRAAAGTRALLEARAVERFQVSRDQIVWKGCTAAAPGQPTKTFFELLSEGNAEAPQGEPSNTLSILGSKTAWRPRIDAACKVTGEARFGIDIGPEDLRRDNVSTNPFLVALVARPGRLGDSIDLDHAETRAQMERVGNMPGVKAVVPLENGRRGVAVVADSFWRADKARRAFRPRERGRDDAVAGTRAILQGYEDELDKRTRPRDDAPSEDKRAAAGPTPWRTYVTPFGPHAAMEPLSAVCGRDKAGTYHVYAATQFPESARAQAARILGGPVLIHGQLAGGAFGRRAVSDFIVEVAEIYRGMSEKMRETMPECAVKLMWTREDDFRHDYLRPAAASRVRAAVTDQLTISSWDHLLISESPNFALVHEYLATFALGTVVGWIPPGWLPINWRPSLRPHADFADFTIEEGLTDSIYGIRPAHPLVKVPRLKPAIHGTVRVGYWRSVGCFHTIFAVESMLDELAWEKGSDPLEIRLRNLGPPGGDERKDRMRRCVQRVAALACEDNLKRQGTGYGIACFSGWESFAALVVRVTPGDQDPREIQVAEAWAAVDCGFVLNPDVLDQQVEGGIIFGLSAALKQEITTMNGVVRETNFHACDSLRIHECPTIHVVHQEYADATKAEPTGVGELMVPLPAPAVANAVFNLTGRRFRRIPLGRGDDR